ncbi:serpin family protein [Endozoicomonas sp. 4G]|uniref:serpin family protein n=1 Tax=Endozoicomonas sp. 4G TaxID=2872754 RepID=UPI00207907DF|nr:serpin family protein [Endozoicomonas sp. 4G]
MYTVSNGFNPQVAAQGPQAPANTAPASQAHTHLSQTDVQHHISKLLGELSLKLLHSSDEDSVALSSESLAQLLGLMVAAMDDSDKTNREKEKLLGLEKGSWSPELEKMIHSELGKLSKSHPYQPPNQRSLVATQNFLVSAYQSCEQSLDTTLKEYYGTEKLVPVGNESVADRTIEFVKKATHGRVPNVLEGIVSEREQKDMPFIFGNVLNVDGRWQDPFKSKDTSERWFTCANGNTVKNIQMMEQTGTFRYKKYCDFFAIAKGLQSDSPDYQVDLIAIIPDKESLYSISDLDCDTLKELTSNVTRPLCRTSEFCLKLPKIAIDCAMEDLQTSIEKIQGVKITSESLVSKLNFPQSKCGFVETVQVVKADVNEQGAYVEAKTATRMTRSGGFGAREASFDRPFFLAIVKTDSNGEQRQLMASLVQDQRFLVPSENGIEIVNSGSESHSNGFHSGNIFYDSDSD